MPWPQGELLDMRQGADLYIVRFRDDGVRE